MVDMNSFWAHKTTNTGPVLAKAAYILAAAMFMLVLQTSPALAQSFESDIDRSTIELGDSVALTFTYTGDAKRQAPDFDALQSNFVVRSYYPSLKTSNINGQITITNSWRLIVEPKSKGRILIPPITFMGQSSEAIELRVTEPSQRQAAGKDIFLETVVDKSTAYVQEQIKVTYRLYYSVQIEVSHTAPEINDAIVKPLENKQYQRRIDGKPYRVEEVSFVIFAERSGALVVPQTTWEVKVAIGNARSSLFGNFGRFESRTLRSDEKTLRVKPIPDSFPKNATWLPAKSLNIEENWSTDSRALKVGEPVTRTIQVTGHGIESAQISDFFPSSSSDFFKLYKEPARFEDTLDDDGLIGARTESGAIVAAREGDFSIDAILIPWWNTETDSLEYARIAETTMSATRVNPIAPSLSSNLDTGDQGLQAVTPINNENAAVTPLPTAGTYMTAPWLVYVLAALNLLLLVVVAALIVRVKKAAFSANLSSDTAKQNRNISSNSTMKQLLKRLKLAADTNQTHEMYDVTQELARTMFELNGASALKTLAKAHDKAAIVELISSIEVELFGTESTQKAANIDIKAIEQELRQLQTEKTAPETAPLKALY